MVDPEKLIQRLMTIFLQELDEHLGTWPSRVVQLEQTSGADHDELLKELYRTVHSLKGASRSVRLPLLVEVCHHLEDRIGRVQRGEQPLDAETVALLASSGEVLGEVRQRLEDSRELGETHLPGLLSYLQGEPGATLPKLARRRPPARQGQSSVVLPALHVGREEGRFLKVGARYLDKLLARHSELRVQIARLEGIEGELDALSLLAVQAGAGSELVGQVERLLNRFRREMRTLERLSRALGKGVLDARMLPLREALKGVDVLVRDLALEQGKHVRLRLEGVDIEMDRSVLDALKDPIRHLLRNAIDHGIETPEERRRAGKPIEAELAIEAVLRGGDVELRVKDDGRGLQLNALKARLKSRGLEVPSDERRLARSIFEHGMSTASEVSDISGRGVGLDVVQSCLEALHGRVDVDFVEGEGCTFTLMVPLTVTSLRSLMVRCCDQDFAIPGTNVARLLRVKRSQVHDLDGQATVTIEGQHYPLLPLWRALELEPVAGADLAMLNVVVLMAGVHRMGFLVNGFTEEREVVVLGLGARLKRVRTVAGASILPSGKVVLILNVAEVIRRGLEVMDGRSGWQYDEPTEHEKVRLLVVDDSLTARSMMKGILEFEGYEVVEAGHGEEALERLRRTEVSLVVSDVEMPVMNGFELVERIRAVRAYEELPVILVTGLESDADKRRGMACGASAYLVKSVFDQGELVKTIEQLVDRP